MQTAISGRRMELSPFSIGATFEALKPNCDNGAAMIAYRHQYDFGNPKTFSAM
jgi:hypothetical protein